MVDHPAFSAELSKTFDAFLGGSTLDEYKFKNVSFFLNSVLGLYHYLSYLMLQVLKNKIDFNHIISKLKQVDA